MVDPRALWEYLDLPSSALLPIWREGRIVQEAAGLANLGPPEPTRTPRHVLLVPGFLDEGSAVQALGDRLEAMGHHVHRPRIGRNVDCATQMLGRLERQLDEVAAEAGEPVVVVGHSRGGTLSRVLGVRHADRIVAVITAGSPLGDPTAYSVVLKGIRLGMVGLSKLGVDGLVDDCIFGTCCDDFDRDLRGPFPESVALVSIFSQSDGLVAARASHDAAATMVEVDASHAGLVRSVDGINAVAEAIESLPA